MLKSLKLMTLRVALFALGCVFASIGPYLYYTNQPQQSTEEGTDQAKLRNPGDIPDFKSIADIKKRKSAFFDYLRPKIELENQRIIKERSFLLSLRNNHATKEQTTYAERLGRLYSYPLTDNEVTLSWLNEMLSRVNVLPEALVLTQAANESGWGTSRFATQANNLFGQWCYSQGCGIVPERRSAGKKHEVKKFTTVQESVHGYFMNVNRNRSYAKFRDIRAGLAREEKNLLSVETASELTYGLIAYSERGMDYVNDLRAMIRHNNDYWTQ